MELIIDDFSSGSIFSPNLDFKPFEKFESGFIAENTSIFEFMFLTLRTAYSLEDNYIGNGICTLLLILN